MKKLFSMLFVASALIATAQPKKAPKMAPVFSPGFYVGAKGDTVKGEIQTNPDDPTDFYTQFMFKAGKGKPAAINTKKARSYGFDDKVFAVGMVDGEEKYMERLCTGRLNFFEYRFNGKVNGNPGIETDYYIQDNRAEGKDAAKLKEISKLSRTFYKGDLKDYMRDQKMIWEDIDKHVFNKAKIMNSINEFNRIYAPSEEPKEE